MPRSLQFRSLSRSERRVLERKLKDLSLAVRVHQRYRVVDEVAKGRTIAEAADRIGCHFTVAYDWVHRFNESGFATFEQVANRKADRLSCAPSNCAIWSMSRCRILASGGCRFPIGRCRSWPSIAAARGLLPEVTDEWVRRLLRREGLSAQRIRTWKTSKDPHFDTSKKRIRRLYRTCPKRAAVVCFDEWGPLELRPIGGVAWARRKHPLRQRATYRRLQGTEQFLGFYDVHDDCLDGLFSKHKRVVDICHAFDRLRRCYPLPAPVRCVGQPAQRPRPPHHARPHA